jgi:hypothetical protein
MNEISRQIIRCAEPENRVAAGSSGSYNRTRIVGNIGLRASAKAHGTHMERVS